MKSEGKMAQKAGQLLRYPFAVMKSDAVARGLVLPHLHQLEIEKETEIIPMKIFF